MSFPKYDRYKDSGVEWLGEVPENWTVTTAKRVASVFIPQRNKPELNVDADGTYWVTMEDLKARYISQTNLWVSEDAAKDSGSRILHKGAVVASCVGNFGIASINSVDVIINQQLQAFIPNRLIGRELLWYCVCSAKNYFEQVGTSATVIYVNQQGFENMPLALPPLPEQRSIATFLDRETTKIDELIAEQQQLIDLLKEKRQAVISHAVTKGLNPDAPMKDSAIEWLGEVPEHWEVKSLKKVSPEITVGIVVEPSKYYESVGVPALRSLNVQPGTIKFENLVFISEKSNTVLSKSRLRAGDLVSVRSGQPGTTAIIPSELEGCNCIDLIIIRKPKVDSEKFLCWYLNSDSAKYQFSEGTGGAIQQHFNIGTAMQLVIPTPPLTEQIVIADFLYSETEKYDELIAEAHHAIALLQERRTALISAAVTGKIDIRNFV